MIFFNRLIDNYHLSSLFDVNGAANSVKINSGLMKTPDSLGSFKTVFLRLKSYFIKGIFW